VDPRSRRHLIVVAGPSHHDESHLAEDALPAVPGSNLGKRIRSDEEAQLVTRLQSGFTFSIVWME